MKDTSSSTAATFSIILVFLILALCMHASVLSRITTTWNTQSFIAEDGFITFRFLLLLIILLREILLVIVFELFG